MRCRVTSLTRFRTGKINLSLGNELYGDIEQISRHRLPSATLSNVKRRDPSGLAICGLVLVVCLQPSQIRQSGMFSNRSFDALPFAYSTDSSSSERFHRFSSERSRQESPSGQVSPIIIIVGNSSSSLLSVFVHPDIVSILSMIPR